MRNITTGLALVLMGGAVGCVVDVSSTGSSKPATLASLSTAGRLHVYDTPLGLTKASEGLTGQAFSGSTGYTYLAAVDAPTNPITGTTVQATNFAFSSHYAYVVYNTAGAEVGGALEIVDLSNPQAPALVGSVVFTTAEFADVQIVGNYALLVGERSDGLSEAVMVVVDVTNPAKPTAVKALDLTGHSATSIAVDGTTAYVTTGDNGGLAFVDVTAPPAPTVTHFTPLPSALDVLRNLDQTFVLGGSPARVYAVTDALALSPLGSTVASQALAAPARMAIWNGTLFSNAGGSSLVSESLSSGTQAAVAPITGTANGIDVAGGVAILAQGEKGTALFSVSGAAGSAALGSFAFPDERGSANEVRIGAIGGVDYAFLSDGLGGFRVIKTPLTPADPAACTSQWWTSTDPATWWAAPAATSGSSSSGTWTAAAESTSLCLVEQFTPTLSNNTCTGLTLKRVRAIGPHPNEGQTCALTCPAGTKIANAHSRYGEASTVNSTGSYSCTGTTAPASHEIACDVMSDSCNSGSQASCSVLYQNSFCGDPWYDCIKNGRTKWTCVPK